MYLRYVVWAKRGVGVWVWGCKVWVGVCVCDRLRLCWGGWVFITVNTIDRKHNIWQIKANVIYNNKNTQITDKHKNKNKTKQNKQKTPTHAHSIPPLGP